MLSDAPASSSNNGYENAPATLLLATHCVCCGRPLLDAASVEAGMGPHCRKAFGRDIPNPADHDAAIRVLTATVAVATVDEIKAWTLLDARTLANKLVHRLAASSEVEIRTACMFAIAALGFYRLAEKLADREMARGAVIIELSSDKKSLLVRAPFSEDFNTNARRIPGCFWNNTLKVRVCPLTSRTSLWKALCASFPAGTAIIGTRGVQRLPS